MYVLTQWSYGVKGKVSNILIITEMEIIAQLSSLLQRGGTRFNKNL